MKRTVKQMKFKSAFSLSEFIRINHIYENDIKEVETHGNDIVLQYYANEKENSDE